MIEFEKDLNDRQLEAVRLTDAPLLIIAGAGSGKTRVITYKITHLLASNLAAPANILAITFTNKAADEMRERMVRLLGMDLKSLWIRTFHSTALSLLKRHCDRLGYEKNFTVYDEYDRKALIKRCIDGLGLDRETYPPESLSEKISTHKNTMVQDLSLFADADEIRIFKAYEKVKRDFGVLDFDDLLEKSVELFEKNEDLRNQYRERWKYVLCDEYQDVNPLQYRFIRLITDRNSPITVVGDDDQSIYGWRGATPRIFEDFEKDYDGVRIVVLDRNYRSTKNIIGAASALISHNRHRKPKVLWTENEEGEKIVWTSVLNSFQEAEFTLQRIRALIDEGYNLKEMAVFYRTNYQSQILENLLLENRMPYRVIGGIRFFEREEIKDILCYLKVLSNPRDDQAVRRILNIPQRGIGDTTIKKLAAWAAAEGISFYDALPKAQEAGITKAAVKGILGFLDMFEQFKIKKETLNVMELARLIVEKTGYKAHLEKRPLAERENRLQNLDEFLNLLEIRVSEEPGLSLDEYVEELTLYSVIDSFDLRDNKLNLITLHNAKGLEFPVVFIIGCEDNLIPHRNCMDSPTGVEEERRLFYVGITRAKKRLYLLNAFSRQMYGQSLENPSSMFIREIPAGLMTINNLALARPYPGTGSRKQGQGDWHPGDIVRHPEYGMGVIKQIYGEDDDAVVKIKFENGEKKFIMRFAQITKI
jgi:DNA helicase II / ATP-dependent DNA helicase PcrA